ncbi:hypothetical protein B005_5442 [Nocardiopsis alba ATCC BAA-2165]|uniref:Uncharacterized protein n=1 Tax=Nocardiopsis alba (strain ATCC BAA-2165 / BE74) TaxID=1205910 RepID=J7L3K9_NOCAA|nr:hypothetical protein B005_5442 [Nocardiopsis alba ATCC BAA-2165]
MYLERTENGEPHRPMMTDTRSSRLSVSVSPTSPPRIASGRSLGPLRPQ